MPHKKDVGASQYTEDALTNALTGRGSTRDKSIANTWSVDKYDKDLLSSLYSTSWLAKRLVTVPAKEAVKNWRKITTSSMTPDQVKAFERRERSLKIKRRCREALYWSRLYGGAVMFAAVGNGSHVSKLDHSNIPQGTSINFVVLDRNEISPVLSSIDKSVGSPGFARPTKYMVDSTSKMIDSSRLVLFDGIDIPKHLRESNSGWGASIFDNFLISHVERCEEVLTSLNELLKQAKIDVVSIPDLFVKLSNVNTASIVRKRFAEAEVIKEAYGTLLLDSQEQFAKHELGGSLSGGVSFISAFFQIPSAATGIPVTKLLGVSPGGLNATGESDLENFYGEVQDVQDEQISDYLDLVDPLICQSLFGYFPEDWSYEFAPLWQTDKREEEEISEKRVNQLINLGNGGYLSPSIVSRQIYEDGRFSAVTEDFVKDMESLEEEEKEEEKEEPVVDEIGGDIDDLGTDDEIAEDEIADEEKP